MYSLPLKELFRKAAPHPASFNALTWSFMRDISGEMTIVIPSSKRAGIW